MIATLTPNPSLDRTVHLRTLQPGRVHRADREAEEPSGKGVNVTRALLANGRRSVAILPVGGAAGHELAARLTADRVPFVGVPVAGAVRANVSLVEADGTTTKINTPGPEISAAERSALLAAARTASDGAAWLAGAGSLPPGLPPAFYVDACRVAHAAGARFALDSSGPALAAALAAGPDVVKPNAEELAEATGRGIGTVGDALDGAGELLARGARAVLVSLGPDGALLVTPGAAHHARSSPAAVRSTVGAGDALLAGFLAAGGEGVDALRGAVAWATAAVGAEGSRVPEVGAADLRAVAVTARPDAERPLRDPAPGPRAPSAA